MYIVFNKMLSELHSLHQYCIKRTTLVIQSGTRLNSQKCDTIRYLILSLTLRSRLRNV